MRKQDEEEESKQGCDIEQGPMRKEFLGNNLSKLSVSKQSTFIVSLYSSEERQKGAAKQTRRGDSGDLGRVTRSNRKRWFLASGVGNGVRREVGYRSEN